MKITLQRYSDNGESTLGLLFINDVFACYTIEDTHRDQKVAGKTRIPAGNYQMKLRKGGGMVVKYDRKYPAHDGMLWLKNVPSFNFVYIHVGNTAKHSEGCILVGNTPNNNQIDGIHGFVGNSSNAYTTIYPIIKAAIEREYTYIEIVDESNIA